MAYIPFFIAAISALIPWPAAFFDEKFIIFIPDAILISIFFITTACIRGTRFILTRCEVFLIFFIAIHVGFALLDGRGVGSGGLILLVTYVILFRFFLMQSSKEVLVRSLLIGTSLLYGCHVLFLWIELFVRFSGGTQIILDLFGHALTVTKYKDYNSANFLWSLGFTPEQITGLNSLLLGSQSASQLALFSALWFAPIYLLRPKTIKWSCSIIFLLSLLMVPIASSMASSILLSGRMP